MAREEPMEPTTGQATQNPAEMLREDHRRVKELFERFEEAQEPETKAEIVREALRELKVHTALEEEIFYPAVRQAAEEGDLVDEALEEHHVAKLLIEELEGMGPDDEHFDAKFKVLAESVKHHIEEEESEMLPKAERSEEIVEIGEEMTERKQELLQEVEGSPSRTRRSRKGSGGRRARSKKKE